MNRTTFLLSAIVLIGLCLGLPERASAQSNLRIELARVAADVKKTLEGRGEDSVAVGQFTGPAHIPTSAGPAIAQVVSEELKKVGLNVKQRANFTVEGRYRDVVDADSKLLAAQLTIKVLDRQDEVVIELQRGIFGDATIPTLFGLTTHLPPDANAKDRSEAMTQAIDKPSTTIANSRVSAGKGSPFAIEVLVKPSNSSTPAPRGAEEKDGLAFVPIARGEVYQVRLINDSNHEAAVVLSIDGLSMFSFSDLRDPKSGQPKYHVVLVPAKGTATIPGWHRSNEHSEQFEVTEYAKSAAAELKSTANIGTITACFMASWPEKGQPPADEPTKPGEYARSGDATGRGARVGVKYDEVKRNLGVIRATVSVRYTK
jgi:hypothetical protein